MSLLSFEHVYVHYGEVAALTDVSFEVDEGEMVGIIGRNGAGKTSILRTIAGLTHPSDGSIYFRGKRHENHEPHDMLKLGIAYVPEGRRIFSDLTVEENLKLGGYLYYRQKEKKTALENLERWSHRFPILMEKRAQVAGTLSGGEQQMLAIARALMSDPMFVLLDEPSMGLAPVMVTEVFEIVEELARHGKTILLVEQKAYLTLQMVGRAYVLTNGRITHSGVGEELLREESIKAAYLGQRRP